MNTKGKIIKLPKIRRGMLKASPESFFVFGDNMHHRGFGGQAAEMRGEPNAIGIPTKWAPSTKPDDYFSDPDKNNKEVSNAIDDALNKIENALDTGHDVVLPSNGIGTGRAELPKRAPRIFDYIKNFINDLEDKYNNKKSESEELKNCPFCGHDALIEHEFSEILFWIIYCSDCGASIKNMDKYAVIKMWNKRI